MRDATFWSADSWGNNYPPNGYDLICVAANVLIMKSNNPTEFSNALWELCCQYGVLFDEEDEEK